MRPIRTIMITLFAGLALLPAGLIGPPGQAASAAEVDPLAVPLGTHSFGHLRAPDAIVAKAGQADVGWWVPPNGEGVAFGPWSFDLARDGSIYLLDEVNHRLLVWQSRRPTRPAHAVQLPDPPSIADFAVAPDGSIYVTYADKDQRVPGMNYNMSLAALTPSGHVRWKGPTIIAYFNGRLRFGPDGALYWPDVDGTWTPLTTPAGGLLTIAEQRQRTRRGQPLPGGRRLVATRVSDHQWRYALTDQAGQAMQNWWVTSRTPLGSLTATPALVGGDPVVALEVSQQTKAKFLYEYLVLRLGPTGGTRVRFALDAHAVWGDTPITGLRVGPDGRLYQLRSARATGVSIARYSLSPTPNTPPTTTTPGGLVTPSTVAPPPLTSAPAPTVTAPTTPPVQTQPARRSVLPWVAAVAVSVLFAAVGTWWYRRRHPTGLGRHGRPRPAH